MQTVTLTLTLLLCWLVSSCTNHSCTEAGCIDGVEVRFVTPMATDQDISLVLDMDGESIACTHSETQGFDTCDAAGVWFQTSGGSATGFILNGRAPKELTLTLSQGGSVPTSTTVSPTYVEQQPNGPDCPPTCQNAVVQL